MVVVDGDLDSRDLLRLTLEWYGARVTTTALEDGAVTNLVKGWRPDVVLIDLPFRDGAFSLAAALHQVRMRDGVAARLVALSEHHEHTPQEALAVGFDAQVSKPLDPEILERAPRVVLARPPQASAGG